MNILLRTIVNHPARVLLSFGLLFIAAVLMTGIVRFEQDIFKVLPLHNRTFKVLVHTLRTSTDQNRLYLLLKGAQDPEKLIDAGKNLSRDLRRIRIDGTPALTQVTSLKREAISTKDFEDLLIIYLTKPENFLTEQDLPRLTTRLTSQDSLDNELKRSLALVATPGISGLSRLAALDPLNFRQFLIEKLKIMQLGLSFAPGPYLLSPDEHTLLIMATPSDAAQSLSTAQLLLRKIKALKASYPQLEIGITGEYAVAAQEEALVKKDILICLAGSALGIGLLFFLVYRNLIVLSFILLPLGVGLQLALGAMALLFDYVHLLATAFAAVVLGLGIDFAIHVYDRYRMERQDGKTIEQAIEQSVFRTGAAVLVGGITTLVAFLVLTLTDSPLLYQIGWLVALGLLFCLITTLWALPACLVWLERHSRKQIERPMKLLGMDKLGQWVKRRPAGALILSALLIIATLPGLAKINFEQDPLALKPKGLEALDVQQDLSSTFGAGQEYALIAWSAEDIQSLWRKGHAIDKALAKFKREGIVASWTSLSQVSSPKPLHLEGIDLLTIDEQFQKYGLKLNDFKYANLFLEAMLKNNQTIQSSGENHISTEKHLQTCEELDELPEMFNRFFICEEDTLEGIAWVQIPGTKSALLLQNELSKSLPELIVVNPRLAVRELVREARNALWTTVGCAGFLVLCILILFFRRITSVLLVLLPMTMGLLTTAGVMGWCGINLNLFNFIVLPILIGIGLDDSIHILRRHQELGDVEKTLASTGRSVFLTTLTTACGFGSLSLANYHILKGMGLMAIVGVFACFFFSVITLPAILRLQNSFKKTAGR
jgi:predicted exporter